MFFLLIGRFVQQKTYHHLSFERDYKAFFPVAVDVIDEENNITLIALDKIKTGDRILIKKPRNYSCRCFSAIRKCFNRL